MHKNYREILYNIPTIECSDINLRRFTPEDAEAILEYGRDLETLKYLDWPGVTDIEGAKSSIYDFFWSSPCCYAIATKDTNKCIGSIDIRPDEANNKAMFGYVLNRAYWGRGYTTQALKAIIDICFNKLDVNKIESQFYVGNVSSGRVMEKCGMKQEGTSPQSKIIKGNYVDVVTYGILRKEYAQ